MKKISLATGLLLGALTVVPVIVLTFFGNQLLGLLFPPFALFDFMARVLPGGIVTFGIDTIVKLITVFKLGDISSAAKLAEQTIAVGQFVILGGIIGLLLALFGQKVQRFDIMSAGWGVGALLFGFFTAIEATQGFSAARLVMDIIWLGVVFLGWAVLVAWMIRNIALTSVLAEENASRRRALYLGISALIAVLMSALGIGYLFRKRGSGQAQMEVPETPRPDLTSGPAASPNGDVLANRIQPVPGTRPEITSNEDFYQIDINTTPPEVSAEEWRLTIEGLVTNPLSLTIDDIRSFPSVSQYITLSCISNPIAGDLISTSLWTGVRLWDLLQEAGIREGEAREVSIDAVDGFYESVTMEDMRDPRTLLVYAMNQEPLPAAHGFPLRIYIPNRYGMKQPKWITRMEVLPEEGSGYWVDRNWSEEARPHIVSVIDVIVANESDRVDIGGIAWAGDRGISQVEVQIDDGAWEAAELRDPSLCPLTWVQWRYRWLKQPGNHIARVRATDKTGARQIMKESGVRPDGATGVHTRKFRI